MMWGLTLYGRTFTVIRTESLKIFRPVYGKEAWSTVRLSERQKELLCLIVITAATIGAILITIFSISHGISAVFPFLYLLPIILVVYFYPRRAVIFALFISIVYICLVYLLGALDPFLISVSTGWFAIFITIAVVASSYATQLLEEKAMIRHILDTSQEGIFCFDITAKRIREINGKCAQWLDYNRQELLEQDLAVVWPDSDERERFFADIRTQRACPSMDATFRRKDGRTLRFNVTLVLLAKDYVICSADNVTDITIADEEIRKTLEDLDRQVRERTAYLERINEELRAEILERRKTENAMLAGMTNATKRHEKEEEKWP